jgi:hypothetical protein
MPAFPSVVSVLVSFVRSLDELKAGHAGGRLRRPSSAGSTLAPARRAYLPPLPTL